MDTTGMEKHVRINRGLRAAFAKFRHYETFSLRVERLIQSALCDYTVSVRKDSIGESFTISVWGNDLSFRDGLYFSLQQKKHKDGTVETWQEAFIRELDRTDMSDALERQRDEERIIPELHVIQEKIRMLVCEAYKLVGQLPVPASATTRKDPDIWKQPSRDLTQQFPLIFRPDR